MPGERWDADVVLADGGTAHIRPIRPDDGDRLVAFHRRQSAESIYFRFFSPRPELSPRDVERFTHVDYRDRMAFVALLDDDLVGIARYDRWRGRDEAEVAFFVDDAHHGRGLATVLLEYLAVAGREVGLSRFTAEVLPQNRRMLSVFKQAGFEVTSRFADGLIEVSLGLAPTDEAQAAIEERGRRADARSAGRLLAPRSIAVVGAGRRPDTIGHEVFRNLVERDFQGPVYPVNHRAEHVSGVPAFARILDVPDEIDLAIVAVPAASVASVVEDCARKRVQSLIVLSAGFADAGPEGVDAERALVSLARRHGMRLLGPNGMGAINTDPNVRMHATFAPVAPQQGGVALSSQSGTLAAVILEQAGLVGLGISTFVSVGNKADVSGNDLLQYWEDDERTAVVLLYLESFGNPRKFSRIARRVARAKPVVAVKSGRSGAAAAGDGDWPAVASADALLRQTGVIRVDTLGQLLDVARLLVHQPLPRGRRVAIVGNSAGPAALAADACRDAGLQLATLGDATVAALAAVVPDGGAIANPVDLSHHAEAGHYGQALEAVVADASVDSVLALYTPALVPRAGPAVAQAVAAAADGGGKPVAATFFGVEPGPGLAAEGRAVPVFTFPDAAAHALGLVAEYGEWRAEPPGDVRPFPDADAERAGSLVAKALADHSDGVVLGLAPAAELLATWGMAPVPQLLAWSEDEAVAAAGRVGYPVAVKATGRSGAKVESGGLALDVQDDDDLRGTHRRMSAALGEAMRPALVQRMAPAGVDSMVALRQDPVVGSVMALGVGGAAAELRDAAVRVLPLTDLDAGRLVDSSRVASRLAGEPVGRGGLEDLLLRLAGLAEEVPELAEVVLNPVLVGPEGAAVTDVRVRLAPWPRDPAPPVRRLS